ncbi:MAG: hypothetical protein KAS75_02310 [Planctomycetes bacterium]|nr:hypothetical protein [Planctomycetota bacterium]
MNKLCWLIGLLVIGLSAGCHSDIVCTKQLKELDHKCVYIAPIESENPYVGQVLRDVLEKEFMRKRIEICDANSATVFINGSTFMTFRASGDSGGLKSHKSAAANQAIESVTVTAKDNNGQVLLTASYDNCEQYTASKLAKEFGQALVGKFK